MRFLRNLYLLVRRKMIMRHRTSDREATPVHTVEQIGLKRSKTPEGFLLCEDVPIARTGTMYYGPGEVPVKTRDGIAHVTRDADELLNPKTLASFNGKPVVSDHPDVDVRPDNWVKHTKGIVLNPRRGTGDNADCMVADLLITDAATIREVEAGKREVSAGYDADYDDLGAGQGRQLNIIGNHVALVEKGRCGPRCAIGDHQPSLKENPTMGTRTQGGNRTRQQIPEAVRRLFRDAAALMDEDPTLMGDDAGPGPGDMPPGDDAADDGDGHTHIHIHNGDGEGAGGGDLESRVAAIEATLQQIVAMLQGGGEEEAPPEEMPEEAPPEELPADDGGEMPPEEPPTRDRATVGDSAALATSYQELISDAEVLVPGFRMPTFDAACPRKSTVDNMCAQRRRILDHVHSTSDGQKLLNELAGADFDANTVDCAQAAVIFRAAAGARRLANNSASTKDARVLPKSVTMPGAVGKVQSLADLNQLYRNHYAAKPVRT